MLPVRGLAEWNIRNDTKQAYPVATGTCKGFDPLDFKGRTLPNLSGSAVLPNRIIEEII